LQRAREISQSRSRTEGYTQEDWLQARSEFLRPVPVEIEDFVGRIRVRATAFGFDEDELEVSIEPARIIIASKKEVEPEPGDKLFYAGWHSDEILQVVDLPREVEPALARVTFHAGVLQFDLAKPPRWPEWTLGVMDG
jgi:HSP20 family molecular chaperone IbpA